MQPLDAVRGMLEKQAIYGSSAVEIEDTGALAVGRQLYATLPEDSFDRGIIVGGGERWHLAADVRLDAREELCATLGIAPSVAKNLSDSAIVLRAFERWQDAAVGHLVGDFAIICWDAEKQRLLLTRDFLGNRPLHFHAGTDFVAVASMPKGLHALPGIPRAPDPYSVAQFVAMLPEHGSASFFRDVERVGPGELVVINAEGVTRRTAWSFDRPPLRLSDSDYVDALREAFDRAVAARLRRANGLVGTHLSGGLDSSAVTATAARLSPPDDRVLAFTSAPPESFERPLPAHRFMDESRHAAEVAALYPNIEHLVLRSDATSPLAALDRNADLFERPVLNLCNSVWLNAFLDSGRDRGVSVMLIGDMGNMTSSYEGFEGLAHALARGRLMRVAREIALLRRNSDMRVRTSVARMLGSFLPRRLWEAIYRLRGLNFDVTHYTALNRECADQLERDAAALGITNSAKPWSDHLSVRLEYLRRADLGNYFKGTLGGWGVDLRDPTGDQRLVELCLAIPPDQFLRNGRTRDLARRAFADRLPTTVIAETRRGYQGADWYEGLRADWPRLKQETERLAALPAARQIMDVDRLRALVEADPEAKADWHSRDAELHYRLALLRGISAGDFLRRAGGHN